MYVCFHIYQAKGFFITNRAAALGLAAGGVTGIVYKGVGDLLFSTTREIWLEHRVNRELHSKHKTLLVRKSRMVTFEQVQDEQARQNARRKLQQEAEQARALRGPVRKLDPSKSLTTNTTSSDGNTKTSG